MNDRPARLAGIPLLALLMVGAHDGAAAYASPALGRGYLAALLTTAALWEGNRAIFVLLRHWFPRYDQTARRLTTQTLSSIAYTLTATVLLNMVFKRFLGFELCPDAQLTTGFLLDLIPTFFVTSIYESAYFFSEWKKNLQRSEALARASIQGELEALQRQLDPHFLFNSLNTLAALIEPENDPAQQFVEQLADVYRYVLLSRDRATVPLAEELKFVEAYVALNKTRFRNDLQLDQHLAPDTARRSVAPLSVQMLIENALKHNVISAESPLRVSLRAADGYVSVANNVQPKTALAASTKVGLQNIIDRYRLLTERPVEVQQGGGLFTVRLPLLG